MNSLRFAAAAGLLALALAGCPGNPTPTDGGGGGGGGGGGADGGGGLQLSELCEKFAAAVCAREETCKFLDSAQSATCLASTRAGCDTTFARFVTAGARTWDATKAQECLTAITATRCILGQGIASGGSVSLPAECSLSAFPAAGKLNTPCSSSSDCTQGFCAAPFGACPTCTAFQPNGAVCNFSELRCDPDAGTCDYLADAGRQCNPYVAVGGLCTSSVTCDPKTSFCPPGNTDAGLPDGGARACTARLADGQPCNYTSGRCLSGVCLSFPDAGVTCGYRALGAECSSHSSCGPDNYCKGYVPDFPVINGACTKRVAAGGACTNQYRDYDRAGDPRDGCAVGSCLGGTCKTADYSGAANSECDRVYGSCQEAHYCKGYDADQPDGGETLSVGTCTPRLDQDAGCDYGTYFDSDCKQGFTCGNDNVCEALKSAGGACKASYYCKDLLGCPRDGGSGTTGSCTPWQQPGADCSLPGTICSNGSTNDRTGFCLYVSGLAGYSGPGTCSALLAGNAACDTSGQCASGRCRRTDGGSGGISLSDGGRELGACAASCLP